MRGINKIWAMLILSVSSCGGSDIEFPLGPEPATCASAWKIVYAPQQSLVGVPRKMLSHGGQVYYLAYAIQKNGLIALPENSPVYEPLPQVSSFNDFWVDDRGLESIRAFDSAVPSPSPEGFTLETFDLVQRDLVSSVPFKFNGVDGSFLWKFALDADSVFGAMTAPSSVEFSRFNRSTGTELRLASIPSESSSLLIKRLVPWGDWLFAVSWDGSLSIPKSGGSAVPMPGMRGNLFGPLGESSATGQVLWNGFELVNDGKAEINKFGTSQIGSGAAPVEWQTTLPKKLLPFAAWQSVPGKWILAANEVLADGAWHTSVWLLPPSGNAQRLACDPEVGRYATLGTLSPKGLFLAASAPQLGYYTQIAFIAVP